MDITRESTPHDVRCGVASKRFWNPYTAKNPVRIQGGDLNGKIH